MRCLIACCIPFLLLAGCDQKPQSGVAVAQPPPSAAQPPTPAPTPPSEVGRYVIVHSPHIESDTVLLDTETGLTWQLEQLTDLKGEPTVWMPMNRMDTPEDWNRVIAQYGEKAQPRQTVTGNTAAGAGVVAGPPASEPSAAASQQ